MNKAKMKIIKYLVIIGIFFLLINQGKAQLAINVKNLAGSALIDFSYPFYSSYIKVTENGVPVTVTKDEIFLREPAYDIIPAEVGAPDGDGYQQVKWVTRDLHSEYNVYYFVALIAVHDGFTSQVGLSGVATYRPNLYITNDSDQQVIDLDFGISTPGLTIPSQIRIYGWVSHVNEQNKVEELKLTLNSVSNSKPELTTDWQGSDTDPDRRPPPRTLLTGSRYWINVDYSPISTDIFNDHIVFTMDSVVKAALPIIANYYKITGESALKLLTPEGGEKLTPCEDYRISWRGNSTDLPSDLYYSVDNGYSWRYITSTTDSEYTWNVPAVTSDSARIQIRQKFQKTATRLLREEFTPVGAVDFNKNGGRLLSVNVKGKIFEWELVQKPDPYLFQRFYLSSDTLSTYQIINCCYTTDNDHFAVYYIARNAFNVYEFKLALFDRSAGMYPVQTMNLPNGFVANKMLVTNNGALLGFSPSPGSRIMLLNSSDGSFNRYIDFGIPVNDFSFARSTPYTLVSLLGGEMRILDNSDFSVVKTVHVDYEPTIDNVALSPNGKLIAASTVNPNSASFKNNVFVISVDNGLIVRRYRVSAGNSAGLYFNPTSTSLIVGSQTPEQVAVINLLEPNSVNFLDNHSDRLTAIAISPNSHAIATTSIGADNLFYRTFSYPEESTSKPFSIQYAITDKDKFVLQEAYYGTVGNIRSQPLCNKSDVMLDISDVKVVPGTNFDLAVPWMRDTIQPGKCSDFNFVYHPRDTGLVRDTAVLYTCTRNVKIPIEAYSRPRSFSYVSNGFNFGEVCVGDTLDVPLDILTNNDPVPVKINYLVEDSASSGIFMVASQDTGTTLAPGETLHAVLRFVPDKLGVINGKIKVYYADLTKVIGEFNITGKGIGTFVETSHDTLLFIPEVKKRTLTIKNIGEQAINFEGLSVYPTDHYTVLTPYPFNLPKDETKEIEIEWDGVQNTGAVLKVDANPCLVQKYIHLGLYSAAVNVSVIDTSSLPTNKDAVIPIEYTYTENGPYKGIRPFIADIKIDGTLFLPQSVTSPFGSAEIVSNKFDVDGRTRIFRIKINGDFNAPGRLAEIHGIAGLSDTNQTEVKFDANSQFFGVAAPTLYDSGIFKIIGVPDGGYIDRQVTGLTISSISPNPANSNMNIILNSTASSKTAIYIIDNLGQVVTEKTVNDIVKGENKISLDIHDLLPGTYTVSVNSSAGKDMRLLIILR